MRREKGERRMRFEQEKSSSLAFFRAETKLFPKVLLQWPPQLEEGTWDRG